MLLEKEVHPEPGLLPVFDPNKTRVNLDESRPKLRIAEKHTGKARSMLGAVIGIVILAAALGGGIGGWKASKKPRYVSVLNLTGKRTAAH